MTHVIVDVTQEDIDHGKKGECLLCPIARAANRVFPGMAVTVSAYNLWVDSSPGAGDGPGYPLPDEAVSFVQDFDKGRPVQPFEFQIGERIQP